MTEKSLINKMVPVSTSNCVLKSMPYRGCVLNRVSNTLATEQFDYWEARNGTFPQK